MEKTREWRIGKKVDSLLRGMLEKAHTPALTLWSLEDTIKEALGEVYEMGRKDATHVHIAEYIRRGNSRDGINAIVDKLRKEDDDKFQADLVKEMFGKLSGSGNGNQRLDEVLPEVKATLVETYTKSFERTADQAQKTAKEA
ncbi:MAG: hypothetical protein ABSE71_02640 [Candidatus Micrarchaeaceae archaeon]|jgi:uncharacterized membrane-anchored protein YjiN (DUF445 family)|nr:hypothetical protein [Candidatus Micrarchaeota archaeon]HII10255.1 hypothetical protein [Candidatus Micrarchaeota archaeon]